MKPNLRTRLMLVTLAAAVATASAQPTPSATEKPRAGAVTATEPDLPRFDLNFPGGTPLQLVQAIQKEIGVLNAIVPTEYENEELPALRMKNVNVQQLFEALEMASQKTVPLRNQPVQFGAVQQTITTVGFRPGRGAIQPDTVWYYYASRPQSEPKIARYFQLSPYLAEYNVNDITTAIQAGWKMLGEAQTPELNYHQDTKLLIAVGEANKLQVIESVLAELGKGMMHQARNPSPAAAPKSPQPGQIPQP